MFDSVTFHPAFPVWLITALAGAAALMVAIRAWKGRTLRAAWMQSTAVTLRLAAIALLVIVLLNPSKSVQLPARTSRSMVLVDASASMTMGAENGRTRWEEATVWTRTLLDTLRRDGTPEPRVRTFAATVEPVAAAARGQWPQPAPTGQETLLARALESVARIDASDGLDHVIVVSDGCAQDRSRITGALGDLRAAGVTLSTRLTGRDLPARNASLVSVLPPRMVRAQSRVSVPVEMEAAGVQPGETFTLILTEESGTELTRQDVVFSATQGTATTSARLSFRSPARSTRCRLELRGAGTEATLEDNVFTFTIESVSTKLRVLFAEGTHAKRSLGTEGHYWNEMEMMTAAWDATGEIEWEALTPLSQYVNAVNLFGVKFANGEMIIDQTRRFPETREEVFKYDVIIASDVPVGNFSEEQMQWVVEWVTERGGGFLMAGGNTAFDTGNYDKTPWEKITPVDMLDYGDGHYGAGFEIIIPASVRSHPVWQIVNDATDNGLILDSHPVFDGMNRVRRAKPGAVVLAVEKQSGTMPVIAVQSYGRGRSMAYLPDPNGGWGEHICRWSPDNAPSLGERIELGHGAALIAQASQAKSPPTPRPAHPAPFYAQFWVNAVKWLGENSIRWRRDKLSGRITTAQARPGLPLAVAAEFLAETDAAKLPGLDLGARLDWPGSPRVRLAWDRDRREFTGSLPVPADLSGAEVQVLFDTMSGRESITDAARCGVLINSREFAVSAPDAAFMTELASAAGGRSLTTVEEAASAIRTASEARAARDSRAFHQPAWTLWPWWALLMALLGAEWALRRLGRVRETSIAVPA